MPLTHGARDVGRVWEGLDETLREDDYLGALLGRGRAAVLTLLRTPMSTTTRRDADAPGRRYTWPAGRRRAQAFNLGVAAGPRSCVSGRSWARLAPTGDRVDSVDMEGAEPRSPAVFVTVITTSGPGEWDRHKEEGLRPHRRPVARERCREPLCLTPCRGAMIRSCVKRPSTCGPPGGGRPLGSARPAPRLRGPYAGRGSNDLPSS